MTEYPLKWYPMCFGQTVNGQCVCDGTSDTLFKQCVECPVRKELIEHQVKVTKPKTEEKKEPKKKKRYWFL